MEQREFDAKYGSYRQAVEAYLDGLFRDKPQWADLYESMRYSLLAGGKRIRPVLTLEFARLAGLDWEKAVPVACALELVHTYSLTFAGASPPTTRFLEKPWPSWQEMPSSPRLSA